MNDKIRIELWKRIGHLKSFQFKALNLSQAMLPGWNGEGSGVIELEQAHLGEIRTYETGSYQAEQGSTGSSHFKIQNAYQWVLKEKGIQVSHVRYGLPMRLFEIRSVSLKKLASLNSHVCGKDHYSAEFCLTETGFTVEWKIKGAIKDEKLFYSYFI